MKKEITAEYMHKLLKDGAFKDVDLSRLATMSDDERRVFTIEQADRLLGEHPYGDKMRWFMGQFFEDEFVFLTGDRFLSGHWHGFAS